MNYTKISKMTLEEIESFIEAIREVKKIDLSNYFFNELVGDCNGSVLEQLKFRFVVVKRDQKLKDLGI